MAVLNWVFAVAIACALGKCTGTKELELKVGFIVPYDGIFGFRTIAAATTMAVEDAKEKGHLKDIDIR